MATCITLINDALFSIGATSDINPSTPELTNAAFRRLIQWVNQLAAGGVNIFPIDPQTGQPIPPTTPPTEVGDELGNDPAFDLALSAGFAPWVAPLYNLPVSIEARGAADHAMQTLNGASAICAIPEWPETLPVGGGNVRGPWNRVFFPVPDAYFIPKEDEQVVTP
jgi:hypothetical protein